jgi:hypothetical protein
MRWNRGRSSSMLFDVALGTSASSARPNAETKRAIACPARTSAGRWSIARTRPHAQPVTVEGVRAHSCLVWLRPRDAGQIAVPARDHCACRRRVRTQWSVRASGSGTVNAAMPADSATQVRNRRCKRNGTDGTSPQGKLGALLRRFDDAQKAPHSHLLSPSLDGTRPRCSGNVRRDAAAAEDPAAELLAAGHGGADRSFGGPQTHHPQVAVWRS